MVMKGVTQTARSLFFGAGPALAVGALPLTVPMQAGELGTQLIVGEGTGIPGGTVAVPITLANDVSDSVSADLDIGFPTDLVEFFPPVNVNCVIAERLASTHTVGGSLPQPGGILRFAIFDQTGLRPRGNGELATCNFHILEGVPVGTAALMVEFAQLRNADGFVPVAGVDGGINIVESFPTPTATPTTEAATPTSTMPVGPTATNTIGGGPTATRTTGGGGTPTNTVGGPTATQTVGGPTATRTTGGGGTPTNTVGGGATATRTTGGGGTPTNTVGGGGTPTRTRTGGAPTPRSNEDDGCNVVAPTQGNAAGTLALLLAP